MVVTKREGKKIDLGERERKINKKKLLTKKKEKKKNRLARQQIDRLRLAAIRSHKTFLSLPSESIFILSASRASPACGRRMLTLLGEYCVNGVWSEMNRCDRVSGGK